jgi:hypothetical protein
MNDAIEVKKYLTTILSNQVESQTQQAQYQTQQAQYQTQQAQVVNKLVLKVEVLNEKIIILNDKIIILNDKLDRIEANTITIGKMICSDFTGIQPATKAQIESTGNAALDNPIVQEQIEAIKTGEPVLVRSISTGKFQRKKYPLTNLRHTFQSLGGVDKKHSKAAIGIWVSGICTKLFGVNFKGNYPEPFDPLLENLVAFYLTERQSNGRRV